MGRRARAVPAEYTLATNPSGRALTYGNTSNAQDLTKYDVLVIPEPNTAFTAAERTAIMTFVKNGGGLFLIVDHDQSDRNNDGVDSVDIANQLFSSNGVDNTDPFGVTVAYQNISNENTANLGSGASTHPVVNGAWGTATKSILRGATTFTLDKTANANAKCLLYRASVSNTGSTAASSRCRPSGPVGSRSGATPPPPTTAPASRATPSTTGGTTPPAPTPSGPSTPPTGSAS